MGIGYWLLTIVLFIISLGVLICIHELGHFLTAKLFNVYCYEFSIGFGPKLIHKRKEGKETYFSIRAVPLGGYVSMYGEDQIPDDNGNIASIPQERSLEGIKKWKKAIILSAGIIMNVVLALTIFAVSNICFKATTFTTTFGVNENSIAAEAGLVDGDRMFIMGPEQFESDTYSPKLLRNDNDTEAYGYLIDNHITIGEYHYSALYYPMTNRKDTVLNNAIYLYLSYTKEEIENNDKLSLPSIFNTWSERGVELDYYPVFTRLNDANKTESTLYSPNENTEFDLHLAYQVHDTGVNDVEAITKDVSLHVKSVKTESSYTYSDLGLSLKIAKYWLPFNVRIQNTFSDFGTASIAVFKGLGSLFSGGIKQMSGVVGILQISATYVSQRTAADYLYLWGLISVNLAIFNLLPFPGLDGWQLLVTAIEGATRRKINSKLKSIMSFLGLALLFGLMIVIVILDILRWVGVAL